MSDDTTPIDQVLGWYEDLAPELKQDLAFQVHMLGGQTLFPRPEEMGADKFADNFPRRVRELLGRHFDAAGLALMLCALIDFVLKGRATREDWDATADFQERAIEWAEADGKEGFAATLRQGQERIPLRSRRWIKAAESWSELRAGPLSPDQIDAWLKSAMAGQFS